MTEVMSRTHYQAIIIIYPYQVNQNTVRPVFKGHLYIREKVSLHDRCPFITGSLTWGR